MSRFYTEHRSPIVVAAMEEIERSIRADVQVMNSPQKVKDFLVLRLANLPFEVFGAMFLDAQNRLIETSDLFRGTLTQTSVYPREVVKEALRCNAGGAVFFHNHPSGLPEPSRADELLTRTLKDALGLVDVRVLDHIIVGGLSTTSFAERGLM